MFFNTIGGIHIVIICEKMSRMAEGQAVFEQLILSNFKMWGSMALTLFRMGFFGAVHGWGGLFVPPPSLKSAAHILQ